MSRRATDDEFSRRERQIMDIVYRYGEVAVADVHKDLPEPPSYSATRALIRILEEKGHLKHRQDGPRYLFSPTVPAEQAQDGALRRILSTFFGGSVELAVSRLLELEDGNLSEEELRRLEARVAAARREEAS